MAHSAGLSTAKTVYFASFHLEYAEFRTGAPRYRLVFEHERAGTVDEGRLRRHTFPTLVQNDAR